MVSIRVVAGAPGGIPAYAVRIDCSGRFKLLASAFGHFAFAGALKEIRISGLSV